MCRDSINLAKKLEGDLWNCTPDSSMWLDEPFYTLFVWQLFRVFSKVGNTGIFVMLKCVIRFDAIIKLLKFNSNIHDKTRFAFNMIQMIIITNLFRLGFVQNCLCCQLCAKRGIMGKLLLTWQNRRNCAQRSFDSARWVASDLCTYNR